MNQKGKVNNMKKKYEVVGKLCIELGELMMKLDNLESFMETEEFLDLSDRQQETMTDQLDIMKDYATVLGRRIEDLT